MMGWILLGIYSLALSLIFCYSIVQLHLAFLYLKNRSKLVKNIIPKINAEELPIVTIQLPTFNELYVVERLIDCIVQLDYPKEKLEIQMLDDSTDETTSIISNRITRYQKQGIDIQLIRRPERTGYKAGALKYGLEIAKGKFIAIFDADFLPNKDFLQKTIPFLVKDEQLGVVQTRWEHLNKHYSTLTELQAFGLDAHFIVEQGGRNGGGHFINFNGTGGVWSKECIYDAGNWESDTLTEDLDLSYRAQLQGWKFKYLEDVCAPAELPATMNALKSQQFRWNKGAAENTVKNMKRVFQNKLSIGTRIHSMFHLLSSTVFIPVFISALVSVPLVVAKRQITGDFTIIFQLASVFLLSFFILIFFYGVAYFRINKFSILLLIKFLCRFPLFMSLSMGLSLHNSLAVIEGYSGKKSPFIRTPKFNIKEDSDTWKKNIYRAKTMSPLTLLEGILGLYFAFGIYLGFLYQDHSLTAFHCFLTMGFSVVFYYSIKHAKFS